MRSSLFKPEYLLQPKLIWRRIVSPRPPADAYGTFDLPWTAAPLRARHREEHGRMLHTLGVVDLPVTEAIYRLTAPGETVVDAGANIGYMTSVMAARVAEGAGGCVWSFEAHPETHRELAHNIHEMARAYPQVRFQFPHQALSSRSGFVALTEPSGFDANRGLASVVDTAASRGSHRVACERLDALLGESERIGVLKIDVEGHELDVLRGSDNLLRRGLVRDCVFEEHHPYPSPVTTLLEDRGYTLFFLQRRFRGPGLADPVMANQSRKDAWLPTSFLATLRPDRAQRLFTAPGWRCLRPRRRAAA